MVERRDDDAGSREEGSVVALVGDALAVARELGDMNEPVADEDRVARTFVRFGGRLPSFVDTVISSS